MAADKYVPEVFRGLVTDISHGIRMAYAAAEPASLHEFSFQADGLQKNRRRKPGQFDGRSHVLVVKGENGNWLGGLVNLAIHGTALTGRNLLYSADVNGAIASRWEDSLHQENRQIGGRKPVVLFVNGAEGDVAPIVSEIEGMATIGASYASQALSHLREAQPVTPAWTVKKSSVALKTPKFNLRACMPGSFFLLRWLAGGLNFWVRTVFPTKTNIWSLKLGDLLLMTWPGEANTSLGLMLHQEAQSRGVKKSWVMGLTNDHLAYFTSPEEYQEEVYESCNSLYGAQGGVKIVEGHRALMEAHGLR